VTDILPGPLTIISRAIEARLQDVLPPAVFTYRWLPAKMDKTVWDLLIQRCPSVSLEFVGFERAETSAQLYGTGVWNVWLALKNARGTEAVLFGDSLGQGALLVQQVAMVALHAMVVKGAGTVLVVKALPMALEGRDDPNTYVVRLTLMVERVEILPVSVLSGNIIGGATLATEVISWSFGDSGEIDQTDIINNTGTS
jgi:hypothetical protein